MGWRGGWGWGWSPWPGRGPFSYLPPWLRPGWVFRGRSCWWLWCVGAPYPWSSPWPMGPEEELKWLEEYRRLLEDEIKKVEEEIKKVDESIKKLRKEVGAES